MNSTAHGILPPHCCLPVSCNQWRFISRSTCWPLPKLINRSYLSVTLSQCHSYATSTVLACYKTLFVHPPLFNAATSNHSKNWSSRSWIRIITKNVQHAGGFWFYFTASRVGNLWIGWMMRERIVVGFQLLMYWFQELEGVCWSKFLVEFNLCQHFPLWLQRGHFVGIGKQFTWLQRTGYPLTAKLIVS